MTRPARAVANPPISGGRAALIGRAAAGLTSSRIDWALLRGDMDDAEADELDLLVEPSDAGRLSAILGPAGFARILTWGHGAHRFYVAYEPEDDRWLKFDFVTRIEFRDGHRVSRAVVDAVLRRRIRIGDVWRLHPADAFWLQLLHCLLDRGLVRDRDLRDLRGLLAAGVADGPVHDLLALRAGVRDAIPAMVERGDRAGLLAAAPALSGCLPHSGDAGLRRHLGRLIAPLAKAVRRPGLTVALLGPDGAGKSTLIRSLATSFYYPVRTYYLGLYGGQRPRLGPFSRLPGAELIAQLIRLWRAYLLAAYHRRRGRLVLYDRHGYETGLLRPGGGSVRGRLRRLLLGRLNPRPDLVLVLDAAPEVLHRRKGEHDLGTLGAQRAAYRRLGARLEAAGRGCILDAERDAASVKREATMVIWDHLVRR